VTTHNIIITKTLEVDWDLPKCFAMPMLMTRSRFNEHSTMLQSQVGALALMSSLLQGSGAPPPTPPMPAPPLPPAPPPPTNQSKSVME
jgi:hypothetical protein